MYMGKGKISTTNKQLICRLNHLCFGMHGHLSSLLKDLQYFFYFKKLKKDKVADLYLQCVIYQLRQIIAVTELIEKLGGRCQFFEYKRNRLDYYRLSKIHKVNEKMAIIDSIANQTTLLESYLSTKALTDNEKVKEAIYEQAFGVQKNIALLKENLADKSVKMPNN